MGQIASKMTINLDVSVYHLCSLLGALPGLWLAETGPGLYLDAFTCSLKALSLQWQGAGQTQQASHKSHTVWGSVCTWEGTGICSTGARGIYNTWDHVDRQQGTPAVGTSAAQTPLLVLIPLPFIPPAK